MTGPDTPPPRGKRPLRRLLLVLASCALGLVLCEVGYRAVLRLKGKPYDGAALEESLVRTSEGMGAFTPKNPGRPKSIPDDQVLHPFYGAERGPDPGGLHAYLSTTPEDAAVEVLVLGGSVSMLFAQDAGEALERALAADPRMGDRPVKVLHGGHAAYKQPQQLNKLALLLAHGYRPDVVINLDGFNEVANAVRNGLTGTHPLYPSPPVWAGLLFGRSQDDQALVEGRLRLDQLTRAFDAELARARRWGLLRSALTGTWVRGRLNALHGRRMALQAELMESFSPEEVGRRRSRDRELVGDPYERGEDPVVDLAVRAWRECSLSMKALCDARGIHYVHALQPTLWDPGAKPITEAERTLNGPAQWRVGVERGYPRLRAEVPQLEAAGVAFLDLSRAFAEDERDLYFDPCHFHPEGALDLVDEVAAAVLAFYP